MSKIVVFLAPGFEEIEALSPVDYLRRAKQDVILVALPVAGNFGRLVTSSHNVTLQADKTFEEFTAEIGSDLPDAVFVPGGMPGSKNVAAFAPALDFIKKMFEQKKIGYGDLRRACRGARENWRARRKTLHLLSRNE